ncbi:MAG TPA: ribonuclease P protein component [Verrucomicrobiae bacterium]|jgi:ribonuclease P protein component|nr:ribonuclease P protein component [Verrucomicrobiae bacterium]
MVAPKKQRLRLDRTMRIKQGRDFLRVKQEGRRLVNGCLIANWAKVAENMNTRLGVVVSKRVGNSVARSRARRLLREAFRVHQWELAQAVDLVLVARPSIGHKTFSEVEQDYLTTLRKAGLLKGE